MLVKLSPIPLLAVSLLAGALLSGCSRNQELADGGVYTTRSACPIVGVPAGTGDVTLFNPSNSRDASAIDVTATITNVIASCDDASGDRILSNVAFDVNAIRTDASQARTVVLPYFVVVLQGGSRVVSKKIGQVGLTFPAGSYRAQTRTQAVARVARSAATLPANVRAILNQPRKAGDVSAAIDPLSDPAVRTAVASATFEHLVGFQMSYDQLRYNATR